MWSIHAPTIDIYPSSWFCHASSHPLAFSLAHLPSPVIIASHVSIMDRNLLKNKHEDFLMFFMVFWFYYFFFCTFVHQSVSFNHNHKTAFFYFNLFYGCIWWDLPGWFLCLLKLVVNLFGFQTSLHSSVNLIFLHQFLFLLLLRLLLLVNSISSCWIFVAPTRRIWLNTSAHIS